MMINQLESPAMCKRSVTGLVLAGLCTFALTGCKVGPNYTPPTTSMPDGWAVQNQAGIQPEAPPVAEWWKTLSDPTLDSLVVRAVDSNLDLQLAESRIREARAQRGVVQSDLWPTVNVDAEYERRKFSENSFNTATGTGLGTGAGRGSQVNLYQVGFDAVWELDVFGGIRRAVEAADADIGAATEGRRDVLVTLLAEMARNYVDVRAYQRRLEIARQNIIVQQESLEISTSRFNAGLVSELDVAQARIILASTKSQVPALESLERQSIYSIALLLGQEPASLVGELSATAPIPGVPTTVPIGLPSELLRRRPDIREAERKLAAATARVGAATADLFPKFSLTGSLGLSSNKGVNLFEASSNFWSIGPTASWPVFDAGRIRSNINVQDARDEQAAIVYEQAVLGSLRDVESALVAWWKEQVRHQSLADAVDASRRAVELSDTLYKRGLTTFLNVLESQRAQYASEDQLVQSDQAVVENLIAVYKALGGGWEPFEPPAVAINDAEKTKTAKDHQSSAEAATEPPASDTSAPASRATDGVR